jgi:short-subunit dehydrogenase
MALVTGASSGIGAEFARQLAEEGYDLTLVARRTGRLEALAAELTARYGVGAEVVAVDLTRDEDVGRVGRLLEESANLALLVNGAGFGTKGFFFETDPAPQDDMHRLHVLAAERLTRAALPGMVARRRGGIINVSSVASFIQNPGHISYCATKAWMNSFSEGLYMELKTLGSPVAVQALCPGYTWSEFHGVAGLDRGEIRKSWWMTAEFVVRESLRGLKEGKLFVIPGWRYRLIVRLVKLVPRPILIWGAARHRKPLRG